MAKAIPTARVKKKAVKKKAVKKKPATRKITPRAADGSPTISAIALSRDGASCAVVLSSKRRIRMSAAAAHAARLRIGGRWTDAIAARIERFEHEQKGYARALELLAKHPGLNAAQLAARLGGGRDADVAVKSLVEHGWL